jgi:DNA-binding NtrC family response regulator
MPPVRQPRILLIEDEPQVYQTLQRRLQSEYYDVTLATNYDDAYARLRSEHFHLAIIDIRLNAADESDQSGLQLLKDMTDFKLNGIMPCIVITAIGTLPIKIPALSSLREARFIEKGPGYISLLQDAIRELLGEYRQFSLEYVAHPAKISKALNMFGLASRIGPTDQLIGDEFAEQVVLRRRRYSSIISTGSQWIIRVGGTSPMAGWLRTFQNCQDRTA